MKKMWEFLKGVRKIELFAALVALAILLMQFLDTTPSRGSQTALELRLEGMFRQIEGVGRVEVMVTESDQGIQGVLVVAEGADDLGVCLRLQYAVQALLDVDASKIEIIRRANG